MWWQLLVGALLGASLSYGGAWLTPRWMDSPPGKYAAYAAAAVGGVLAALLAAGHGLEPYFWTQLVFLTVLVVASLVDLYERIIPNEVVLFGLAAGVVLIPLAPYPDRGWLLALGGAAAGFLFLLVLALIVKGGMGFGDVKLTAVIGLFLGLKWVAMGLVLAFLAGGLYSAVLLLMRRAGRKSMIPFGPFLALGAVLTVLYGEAIWTWYVN